MKRELPSSEQAKSLSIAGDVSPVPKRPTVSVGPSFLNFFRNCLRLNTPPAGKGSNYILYAASAIKPDDKVILCFRVSQRSQHEKGNLADQKRNLLRWAEENDVIVVDDESKVGPGWDGAWLMRAAEKARKHGSKLVAETTNRFIRSSEYHSAMNPDAQASEEELQRLASWTQGVILATLLNPDATAREERAFQTKRGQEAKGRKGGRPPKQKAGYMVERRRELLEKVVKFRERKHSIREIAGLTEVPRSTIQDWLRKERAYIPSYPI